MAYSHPILVHRLLLPFAFLLILFSLILIPTASISAATFNPGCDLTQLALDITTAGGNGEADTINLASGCTYTLAAMLTIAADGGNLTTINGNGATLSGNNAVRVLFINSGANVSINSVTVTAGNFGGIGGGIYNGGTLTLTSSTVSGNTSGGSSGGIENAGTLTLNSSTVSGNTAGGQGGGIFNYLGTLTLTNSTVSGNSSGGGSNGGGIFNFSGTMTVNNSTVSGNSAGGSGGGIYNAGTMIVNNSIIANASAGGDCSPSSGTPTITNSLIEDGGCGITNGVNGNKTGDPNLGALTGSPAYFPLNTGSSAINAGSNALVPGGVTTDQAGNARIQGGIVDMGSYESDFVPTNTPTNTPTPTATPTSTPTNTPTATPTITVDTLTDEDTDNSQCSLREAIANANGGAVNPDCVAGSTSSSVTDVIILNVSGTYLLTAGQLNVSFNSRIEIQEGTGVAATISGNNASRIFSITSSSQTALTFSGLTLQDGSSASDGGCIIVSGSSGSFLDISDSHFENCNAGDQGGAISVLGISHGGSITNTDFVDNSAGTQGGAVYLNGTALSYSFDNSDFTQNEAGTEGGALYATLSGGLGLTGSAFTGNVVDNGGTQARGGALWLSTQNAMTISGLTFSGNSVSNGTSENKGGAIYFHCGTLNLSGSVFSGNSSSGYGGAISVGVGTATCSSIVNFNLSDTRIESNSAALDGDAIYSETDDTQTLITSCVVGNGDTALYNTTGTFTANGGGNINNANWWGSSWGPYIDNVTGSRLSSGDSINGNGTSGSNVDVGWISGGDEVLVPPTGAWLTSPPTVGGTPCLEIPQPTPTPTSTPDFGNLGCNVADLVYAIGVAGSNGQADTINLAAGCTYTLTATLTINADSGNLLTINGNGATLNGNNAVRVLLVNSGANVSINNVTISNGYVDSGNGGGINSSADTLTLTGSTVTSNSSTTTYGGGIFNSSGTLTLTGSTVSGNSGWRGGGIFISTGTATVTNSTISGNSSSNNGGGIINAGVLTLNNSTVSANGAFGSGVNGGGGGIDNAYTGTLTLNNSIIANSTSGGDCSNGAALTASYSVIEDGSCGITNGVNGNKTGDPNLGAATGSPAYFPLNSGSSAINAGSNALVPGGVTTDQAGNARIQNLIVDMGSFESAPPPTPTPTPTNTPTNTPTATYTPSLTPPAPDTNLVSNGTFSAGLTNWAFSGTTQTVTNGELNIAPTSPGGSFFQFVNFNSAGEIFEVNFRARNASLTQKTLNMMVRDSDWSPSYNCVFGMTANTPFQYYRMRFDTSDGFIPMVLQGAITGDSTLGLVIDDISMVRRTGISVPTTECTVSPPANTELVFNGSFNAGTGSWAAFNATMNTVNVGGANGSIMQIGRNVSTPDGGFYQYSPYSAPANGVFQFSFQIGNQSNQSRVINMLVRSQDWADVHSCFITVPPNTPLTNMTIMLKTATAWTNIVVQGWIQVGDYAGRTPPFMFDNLSLMYLPGSSFSGSTQCPSPLPLPQRPTATLTPSPTPSLTATLTPSPSPINAGEGSLTPSATATASETPTSVPTIEPPTLTPEPPTATDVPTAEPPTPTPLLTDTPTDAPTIEPPTPEPLTSTPELTAEVTQSP